MAKSIDGLTRHKRVGKTQRRNRHRHWQHRQNRRQNGAGFFNTLRSFFGRKPAVQPPEIRGPPVPKNWTRRLVPEEKAKAPGFFARLFGKKVTPQPAVTPAYVLNTNLNRPFEGRISNVEAETARKAYRESDIESFEEGIMRSFAYMYQKIMNKGRPYNPNKITLTPNELRNLKRRVLVAHSTDGKFNTDKDLDEISRNLFGMSLAEFNEEYKAFEDTPTPDGRKSFHPFGQLARIFPTLLKTDVERQYDINQVTKQCVAASMRNNSKTLQDSSVCVLVTRSIERVLSYLEESPRVMYLVVFPQFTPIGMNRFSESGTYSMGPNAPISTLYLNELDEVSFVDDAFEYGGIQLIHPRLGFLLQTEKPWVYGERLFLPKYKDPRDRIAVLTLQKYAAIRRYMWTKNPELAAEVYRVDPRTIADELRAPYITFPGEKFDNAEFFREFRGNQKFVGGDVKYMSYGDPSLQLILPNQGRRTIQEILPWMTEENRRNEASIKLKPLPEEAEVGLGSFNTVGPVNLSGAVPYEETDQELATLQKAQTALSALQTPRTPATPIGLPKPTKPKPAFMMTPSAFNVAVSGVSTLGGKGRKTRRNHRRNYA